jgi:hypothetical protein
MKTSGYRNPLLWLVVTVFALSSPGVLAQDAANDDLDVTMRMVTDDESLTDSVVREIRLTVPIGLDRNREAATNEIAREAREQGREFGQETADRARDAGRLRNEKEKGRKPGSPGQDRPEPGRPDNGRPDNGRPDNGRPDNGRPETGKPQIDRGPDRVIP